MGPRTPTRTPKDLRKILATALVVGLLLPAQALAADAWPMVRADPHQSGSAGQLDAGLEPASWTQALEGDPGGDPSPLLAALDELVLVSAKDGLVALEPGTGEVRWRFDREHVFPAGPPVVAHGRAYVASAFLRPYEPDGPPPVREGRVHALDTATGDPVWNASFATPMAFTAATEHLVLATSASLEANSIVALAASNGTVAWNRTLPEAAMAGPVVADGTALVTHRHGLTALSLADGSRLWSHRDGHTYRSSPAVAQGHVYVGSSAGVRAFDLSSGELAWSTGGQLTAAGTVAWTGGNLVGIATATDARGQADATIVYSLDATTGEPAWRAPVPDDEAPRREVTAPVVGEASVFFGFQDGEERDDEVVAWDLDTGERVDRQPIGADGAVVDLVGVEGDLVAALGGFAPFSLVSLPTGPPDAEHGQPDDAGDGSSPDEDGPGGQPAGDPAPVPGLPSAVVVALVWVTAAGPPSRWGTRRKP